MENTSKKSLLSVLQAALYAVAGVAIIIMLGYFLIRGNLDIVNSRDDLNFTIVDDYIFSEEESADSPTGIKQEYTFKIPGDVGYNTYFAFYAVHQYAEVYIGDEAIYSLKPGKDSKIGKTVGSNWIVFPIFKEDEGKELRVEITPVYESFIGRKIEFMAGSRLAIYTHRLKKDLPQIILGALAVMAGIAFIGFALYNFIRRREGKSLAFLGLFSLMMGIWRLTDTRFTPFVMPDKSVFLFYTSIAMLMLGTVPMIKSIQDRFNRTSARIFDVYCIASAVVCIAQVIMQMLNIMDIRENLFVTHVMIFIGILTVVLNSIYDNFRAPKDEKGRQDRRMSFLCVAGMAADGACFYIRSTSSGLIFTLSAFLIYIVFLGINMAFDYGRQEARLKEQEIILAENRISTMISQIQPHFLFNSLTAIKHLCSNNAQDAREAIDNFSFFLRGSLEALSLKHCVTFEHELEITKNYLYLEQKRFGDKLKIEYDIKENAFFVPALSVQPIVENAVRHGIRQKDGNGCVRIETCKDKEAYIIKIIDDGVGFDTEKRKEDGTLHVGISNVESRLKLMCGGTLEILSAPGRGTQATMRIPIKE